MTEDTNSIPPTDDTVAVFHFSMVLAEVVFMHGKGQAIDSRRVQFFSKSDQNTFPAGRLQYIQNVAAMQVREQMQTINKDNSFQAIDVLLHNIQPLGWMTDEQFYGKPPAPVTEPVANQEAAPANVTPIKGN